MPIFAYAKGDFADTGQSHMEPTKDAVWNCYARKRAPEGYGDVEPGPRYVLHLRQSVGCQARIFSIDTHLAWCYSPVRRQSRFLERNAVFTGLRFDYG